MGLTKLDGLRVLIVEDDALLAYDLEDLMREAGADPVGPALSLAQGQRLTAEHAIDVALLDIDLGSVKVWPLAEALLARRIPFGFISAQCSTAAFPDTIVDPVCLSKPARPNAIVAMVAQLAGATIGDDALTNPA